MKYKDNITGILIVNKPQGPTSRDIVNKVQKILNTKAGHTGTLDPLAKGVLVITLGKATKLSEIITAETKEYEAEAMFGIETDTLDITGKVTKNDKTKISKEKIINALEKFKKTYNQEVPKYSAIKIDGKKLYEYARENIDVKLPKKEVTIYDIKLLDYNEKENKIKFYTKVSKGTYIRSLIRDISYELNTIGVMSNLTRIAQGKFTIDNSYTLEDIKNGNYKIIPIKKVLNVKIKKVNDELKQKILNGAILLGNEDVLFIDKDGKELALYHSIKGQLKIWKMLYKKDWHFHENIILYLSRWNTWFLMKKRKN